MGLNGRAAMLARPYRDCRAHSTAAPFALIWLFPPKLFNDLYLCKRWAELLAYTLQCLFMSLSGMELVLVPLCGAHGELSEAFMFVPIGPIALEIFKNCAGGHERDGILGVHNGVLIHGIEEYGRRVDTFM